jgi:hypothetical protein
MAALFLAAIFDKLDGVVDHQVVVRSGHRDTLDPMIDRRRVPLMLSPLKLQLAPAFSGDLLPEPSFGRDFQGLALFTFQETSQGTFQERS